MMRIAFFSPLPPQRSGVAIYNAQLLPYLAQHAQITLFHPQPGQISAALRQQFAVRDIAGFAGPLAERFDICLYQMGNNIHYHAAVYATLQRWPGVITLHDTHVHSFFGELYLQQGNLPAYLREVAYAYGRSGVNYARRAHVGEHALTAAHYPLFERLVDASLGVIVHNSAAQQQLAIRCPHTPVLHINLHQQSLVEQLPSTTAAKEQLGYDPDDLLLASFGYVAPSKRIETMLHAVAQLQSQFPQLRYALVGELVQGYNIQLLIAELGLEHVVRLVGYADDALFNCYLAATDVGVNLRYPSRGEMSATLLSLMAAGKPTLISNIEAFADLPADAAVLIDVGPAELEQVKQALADLLTRPGQRQQMGAAAHAHIVTQHHPAQVAQATIDFLTGILG